MGRSAIGVRNGFRWLLCSASASFPPFYQRLQLYHVGSAGPVLWGNSQELASLLLVVFIYALIWRGVKNLSKIFVKLVPVMSLGYLIFGLVIIVLNIGNLDSHHCLYLYPGIYWDSCHGRVCRSHGVQGHCHRHAEKCLFQ